VPIVVGVGAVTLLGGALAFELSAESTYDKTDPSITADPKKQDDLWHSANTKRYVAEGFAVAGVAAAGVAVWLFLRDRGHEQAATVSTRSRLQMAPIVGSDRAGLGLMGTY
jgi:hypothetical protein